MRALSGEVEALGAQLEIRKLMDRAKGILIDKHAMTESGAFTYIQKMAMSERVKMGEIAERIISGDLRP
jgi:response regulator NasT